MISFMFGIATIMRQRFAIAFGKQNEFRVNEQTVLLDAYFRNSGCVIGCAPQLSRHASAKMRRHALAASAGSSRMFSGRTVTPVRQPIRYRTHAFQVRSALKVAAANPIDPQVFRLPVMPAASSSPR
jgi:hypothetical protein